MPKRVRTVGVPGVRAPFQPPVVADMSPASGPVGTVVTFTGVNFTGWQATVQAFEKLLVDKQPLTGDSFTASIPAGTAPGFYDIRVDVSKLFRRVFSFEVTP